MKKLILCGLEGVIMDLLPTVISEYNSVAGNDLIKIKDIKTSSFKDYVKNPKLFESCFKIFDVYRKSRPMKDAVDGFNWLDNKYDLRIFSTLIIDNSQTVAAKIEWIQHWFPNYDYKKIIFTSDYSFFKPYMVINDNVNSTIKTDNLFLIKHAYNKNLTKDHNVFESLLEVYYTLQNT